MRVFTARSITATSFARMGLIYMAIKRDEPLTVSSYVTI
jgi:hypothetical protein